jgi:ubiquinone/menaquinone biosynthesis C-methylase UbiE
MPLVILLAALLWQGVTAASPPPVPGVQSQAESADAKAWEHTRVPDLVAAMRIKPGDTVADLGCGDGIFTVPLARAAGEKGRVIAEDIDKQVLEAARKRIEREKIRNVEVVLGQEDDPLLPKDQLDSVLIMNTYH